MAAALFVVNNLLAAVVACGAGAMVMRGREPWRRVLATLTAFPVVVLVVLLTLGTVGRLSAVWATLVLGVLAAAMLALHVLHRPVVAPALDVRPCPARATPRWSWWIALGLLGAFGGIIVVKTCIVGVQFVTDDLCYHAPAVVPWLIEGKITLTPFNYHAYYPLNSEALSLWFMLPFHADALASVGGLYWATLAVTAMLALSGRLGSTIPAGLLSAGLFLAAPAVAGTAVHFAAVDLAGPAMLLAATAFAVPSAAGTKGGFDRADALFGGLACGFAAGCKVSCVPLCAVVLPWFVLVRQRHERVNGRLAAAGLFVLGAGLTGAYWYARNAILTGNPVFPAQLGPFDGPFRAGNQARTELISWIVAAPTSHQQWWFLLKRYCDWPVDLAIPCIVGYVVAVHAVVFRRSLPAAMRRTAGLLLLVGGAMLVLYPFTPFSGTDDVVDGPLRVALRFLVAPLAVGLVLFSTVVSKTAGYRWVWWLLAVDGAVVVLHRLHPVTPLVAAAGAGLTWLAWLAWRTLGGASVRFCTRPAVVAVALAIGLGALAAWAPWKQRLTDDGLRQLGDARRPVGAAWSALDQLPAGARIAWFGKAAGQYYPLYGRRLQLRPVAVTGDGRGVLPLHERWRQSPGEVAWWTPPKTVDLAQLVPGLISAGADYVFVTQWDGREQPPENRALAASDSVQVVYDDGYSVIYRLPPGGGVRASP